MTDDGDEVMSEKTAEEAKTEKKKKKESTVRGVTPRVLTTVEERLKTHTAADTERAEECAHL